MKSLSELEALLARLDETTEGEFLERLANGRAIALQCMEFVRDHGPAIAAALRAVEGVCVWTIDDIDESWDGSCGAKWQFTEGGPIENETRHCPQCGKTIALVPLDAADGAEGVGGG